MTNLIQFAIHIHRHTLTTANAYQIAFYVSDLDKKSRALHKLYEQACNEPLPPHRIARTDSLEKAIQQWVAQVNALIGSELSYVLNSDPRGYAVYIVFPDGATNDLGKRGWGVGGCLRK
jgi:hypothetical protein